MVCAMMRRSFAKFAWPSAWLLIACGPDERAARIPTGGTGGVVESGASPVAASGSGAGVSQSGVGGGTSHVGSGTVKSFFEDIEEEPPLLTGSIFENGFSLGDAPGFGGAFPDVDLEQTLGLGSGDLTVLALFDRSVSMSDPWEGRPKWQVAGRAFMDGLVGYEHLVTLGAIFFPQAAECDVAPLADPRQIQFQAGTHFKQTWEAFPQDRFPSGGTPLGPAFEHANQVVEEASRYGLLGAGRRFRVAVITDGRPNCGTDPERVLFLANQWREKGVEIHVIGLPGSEEAADFLDELALVGGTQQHNAPVDQEEAEEDFTIVVK